MPRSDQTGVMAGPPSGFRRTHRFRPAGKRRSSGRRATTACRGVRRVRSVDSSSDLAAGSTGQCHHAERLTRSKSWIPNDASPVVGHASECDVERRRAPRFPDRAATSIHRLRPSVVRPMDNEALSIVRPAARSDVKVVLVANSRAVQNWNFPLGSPFERHQEQAPTAQIPSRRIEQFTSVGRAPVDLHFDPRSVEVPDFASSRVDEVGRPPQTPLSATTATERPSGDHEIASMSAPISGAPSDSTRCVPSARVIASSSPPSILLRNATRVPSRENRGAWLPPAIDTILLRSPVTGSTVQTSPSSA